MRLLVLSFFLLAIPCSTFADNVNPVAAHLVQVIHGWSGIDAATISMDSSLRDIWTSKVPSLPYDSNGAATLISALKKDNLLGSCLKDKSVSLSRGEFICGYSYSSLKQVLVDGAEISTYGCGDIQTVKDMYIRFLGCQP